MGPQQAIDPLETSSHARPVTAVEFPDLILRRAPKLALGQFGKSDHGLRRGFVRRGKRTPFLIVTPGRPTLAADPQIAVLRGEKSEEIRTNPQIGRRIGEGFDLAPIIYFQVNTLLRT